MSVYIVTRKNRSGTTYHVRWSKGRYEPYVFLGSLDTKKRAEMRKHKALDLLATGIAPTLEMFKHVGGQAGPVRRLEQTCMDWMAAQAQWAETTRAVRAGYVKLIVDYFGATTVPARISTEDVQRWISDMTAAKLRPTTQKVRLSTLGQVLQFAKHPSNPLRDENLNRPRGGARRKPLPRVSAMAAICAALTNPEDRLIFELLEHTGARPSEITTLVCDQIDNLRDQLLNVGGMDVPGASKTFGRNVPRLEGQPAWVPTRPEGCVPGTRLFTRTATNFATALRAACERAGQEHMNPYQLRHVHASRLLAGVKGGGIDGDMGPADMAHRMGHTVPEFLKTYTHRIPPEA